MHDKPLRVLALLIPERGHINPIAPTLKALEDAGADVVVASLGDVAVLGARLRECGVRGQALALSCPPPPPTLHRSGKALAETIRAPAELAAWIEALLLGGVDDVAAAVGEIIDGDTFDVVVVDPMLYGAVVAAMKRGLPWAALSSSLNPMTPKAWQVPLTTTLSALSKRRHDAFLKHGLEPPAFAVADAISPWLSIAFSADAYAPRDAADAADVFALGAPFAVPPPSTQPRSGLYVSFGSQAFYQPRLFAAVFAAATRLGLDVVASVGDLIDDDAFVASAPPGARLLRYAPQLEILPTVEVAISHGGANSVVEALSFATPLVLLPLCNDQHLQARFMRDAGVGAVVDVDVNIDVDVRSDAFAAIVDAIVDAIERTRTEDSLQKQAAVAASMRTAGGPQRAAALIALLARHRAPLRAREH